MVFAARALSHPQLRPPTSLGVRVSLLMARVLAFGVCAVGLLALCAWQVDFSLNPILAHTPTFKPASAAGIACAGLGLICFTFPRLRPASCLLGIVVALIGALSIYERWFGVDFGLDAMLVGAATTPTAAEEALKMAPGMAGTFLLFGLALALASAERPARASSQVLIIAALAQVLIFFTGLLYGLSNSADPFPFAAMSLQGAIAAFLLCMGLLAAMPDYGIGSVLLEHSPSGEMLRRLLPGVILIPIGIGWFVFQAQLTAAYDEASTLAIFAVASVLVLGAFAWTTIDAIRRADRDRNEALNQLRGQREWLTTTVRSIGDGVIATDRDGRIILTNGAAEKFTGWRAGEAQDRPLSEVFSLRDPATRVEIADVAAWLEDDEGGGGEPGVLLLTRDGDELPIEYTVATIRGFGGSTAGYVISFRDITERKLAAERQAMLVGELNHRVKNTLTIVHSLVHASVRKSPDQTAADMAAKLGERLQALQRAHDLLLESQWSGASLGEMVNRELDPYRREEGPKIATKGPDLLLPPQCTSMLAMTLHELATNAVKYGALSHNAGLLAVSWRALRGNRMQLIWEERGVDAPQQAGNGFGMQLIDSGIRHSLGGKTKVDFRKTGLYVEIEVPLGTEPQSKSRSAETPVPA
jgi:PAS domain S-box-containing protein